MSQTESPPVLRGGSESALVPDSSSASTPNGQNPSGIGTGSHVIGTKRKRLPACDCCKMRRLKCEPVPPPGSCPRCKATGVVCCTTPTVRKKPAPRSGKRIEEAKATFGAADPDAPDFMGASNTPWLPLPTPNHLANRYEAAQSLSPTGAEQRIIGREMDGALTAHLLELYQALPQSWLPIGIRGRLQQQFEAVGRRLDALEPQTEVLARVTIALTSRLSSHPALFSPGGPIPPYDSLTTSYLDTYPDLREYGRRREQVCEVLRKEAVEMAWARGTLVRTCEDSMASCYLLEMLEGRNDPVGGKPYGSAFVSHLQTILNEQDKPESESRVVNMSLGWSALIMRESLFAANSGRTSHLTSTDDLLLCGDVPRSIEDSLLDSVEDVDVRDSVRLFFSPMRPYTYHCARLARECGEKISGTAARRQPCNEQFVTKYLTQLDHLLHLFALLEARIAFVLSPAATSAHSLPAPFETERQFIMRACLHTLGLAWSSLSLPVYLELKRRLADLRAPPPANSEPPPHLVADRLRTLERLELLSRQASRMALKAARLVAQCVHEAPSLAFLTQLQSENLDKWVEVLRSARTVEEGGEGITRAEKERGLSWILAGLKTMGWSWTDGAPVIKTIEEALYDMPAPRRDSTQHPTSFGDGHSAARGSPNGSAGYHEPAFLARSSSAFASATTTPVPSFAATASAAAAPASLPPALVENRPLHSADDFASLFSALTGAVAAPETLMVSAQPQKPAAAPSPAAPSAPPPPAPRPPPTTAAPPVNALPDLATLVSLYQTGAPDPVLSSLGGTDVSISASQYFGGTLDFPSLVGATPSSYSTSLAPLPPPPQQQQPQQRPPTAPSDYVNGSQAAGGEFDLAKFLTDPPFGFGSGEEGRHDSFGSPAAP